MRQPTNTISTVVGRMKLFEEYFFRYQHKRYIGLIPFLHTYYLVTQAVALQGMKQPAYFNNVPALEKFDAYFASLYFKPLEAFLLQRSHRNTPWRTYFDYCSQTNGNAFLEMLLGINAHINSDLTMTIYRLGYGEARDFKRINHILLGVVPEAMAFLFKEYQNIIALGGLVFPRMTHDEFVAIVVRWRTQAWHNAVRLKTMNPRSAIVKLHQQTEQVAEQLIDIFSSTASFLARKHELEALNVKI